MDRVNRQDVNTLQMNGYALNSGRCIISITHSNQVSDMAGAVVPHFHNDQGVESVRIGVKEFMCVGASAPYDHPHVFLDMGDDTSKVCPYCSTLFQFDAAMPARESDPAGCLLAD